MRREPRIVAFCCEHSGKLAAGENSSPAAALPDNVGIISVPCSGSVQTIDILGAFRAGADGVAVFGCHEGSCKHLTGNKMAKKRVEYVARTLEEIGWNRERVAFFPVASVESKVFRDHLAELAEKVRDRIHGHERSLAKPFESAR